jgi:P27 family predicted phage terminase small subunit
MGKRGPRPKPTNLRALHGEKPYRLNRSEPQPPAKAPTCPAHLSKEAKRVWRRLAPGLRQRGLLTSWDTDTFAVLCEAIVHHRRACELADKAILVKGENSALVKNPAMQIVRDTAQTIRAYAQEFGLTPSARVGLSTSMPDDVDKLLSEILDG